MEVYSLPIVTAALVAGLLAGFGIAVQVGAVATYLVTLTARTSLKTGGCAALGVATVDGLYAAVAVIGGSVLTQALRPIMLPLRWASAAVLIGLAIRVGVNAIGRHRQATERPDASPISAGRAYLSLLGITVMNPTTVVYFTSLVLGSRTTAALHPVDEAVFIVAAFAASAGWHLVLAGGGALLGRALTGSRGRFVTAMISSTLIVALAVHLLLPGL